MVGSPRRRLRVKRKANAADVDTIARHGLRHPPLVAGIADAGHGEEAMYCVWRSGTIGVAKGVAPAS